MNSTGTDFKTTGMGRGRGRRPVLHRIQLERESDVLITEAQISKDQPQQSQDTNQIGKDRTAREEEPMKKEPKSVIEADKKPILGRRIVQRNGRYYTGASCSELVQLPKDVEMNTRLLHVDENDILYLRYYQDRPTSEEVDGTGTIETLLSRMKAYYSDLQNQEVTSLRQSGLVLNECEVVVVRLKQRKLQEPARNGIISHTDYDYHRAVVMESKKDRIIVELLDGYGVGGIPFSDIYMILPQFTQFPVQMFQCELAEMELVNHRKIIRTILKKVSIKNAWPDRQSSNHVRAKWMGKKSVAGRPLVAVRMKLKGSDNWILLKTFVFQNLHYALKPFLNLVDNGICFVYGTNREGFLFVRFAGDDELYAKMRFELDTLVQPYKSMLQNWNTTVEMLSPKDDLSLRERNMEKVYVILYHDKKTRISEKLYRVKIKNLDPLSGKVKVYYIDEHIEQEVHASEIIPLCRLHPDLSYIAPLILKVHLYGIKLLQTKKEDVKSILTGEMMKLSLVNEWPRNVHPPEVSMDIFPAKLTEASFDQVVPCNESIQLTGLSKHFVEKGYAEVMNDAEMELWNKRNMNSGSHQLENGSFTGEENERKRGSEERRAYHTFMGAEENHYCFM